MNETERLAQQLDHSVAGGAWHGPALMEVLEGVTPAHAAATPIAGWKSTWGLVLHAIVWQDVVIRRLNGETPEFELGGPQDFPPLPAPPDAAAWDATLDTLRRTNGRLVAMVRALPDGRLDEPILPKYSTCYQHLHGVVQHNLYHAGQIVALKRALGLPAVMPRPEG